LSYTGSLVTADPGFAEAVKKDTIWIQILAKVMCNKNIYIQKLQVKQLLIKKSPNRTPRKAFSSAKIQFRKFETIFPEKELRGHSPNFYIHVSVSDLHIPTIDLTILLKEICGSILGIYQSLTDT
jgi:hypothetical protein